MHFGHSSRFATRLARTACGDLYPGPVLMPRSVLRAVDPLLAIALHPSPVGAESLAVTVERMLRGRPDGPLMLALWASATSGELRHSDLRELVTLMPDQFPDRPADRAAWLGWLEPRVEVLARCVLTIAQRMNDESLERARQLGCGMVLSRLLADLPRRLSQGQLPLPVADLAAAGCTESDLLGGVPTPAVRSFLKQEAAWAREMLDFGLPVCDDVGSRLRRGLRAAILRARKLLTRVEDERIDLFRKPVKLSAATRWQCAVRALAPVVAESQ